jgi:tetratricopeptide (TPR) repeat protein
MKKKRNLLVLGILFGFAWLCCAVLLAVTVHYRSQNVGLRNLVTALQNKQGEYRAQAQLPVRRDDVQDRLASQSLDFLGWKMILTDELREANERLSGAVRATNDLKIRKDLANLLYYALGLTYTAGSDLGAAKHYFDQALLCDPQDAESCYNLGLLYAFSGSGSDYEKAAEYYKKYLSMVPNGKRAEEVRMKLSGLQENTKEK